MWDPHTHTLAHLQSLPLNDEVALWHAIILHSADLRGEVMGGGGERGRMGGETEQRYM